VPNGFQLALQQVPNAREISVFILKNEQVANLSQGEPQGLSPPDKL
jgi:hypothetical protein